MMVLPLVAAAAPVAGQVAGAALTSYLGNEAADESWKRQKKVLQNQVQWRVDDAVKAGLHPLAALGLNPASGPMAAQVGDFGDMGAAGAVDRMLNSSGPAKTAQDLVREGLQNSLLSAQIDYYKASAGRERAGAGADTAVGAAQIGNINVKDPQYAQRVQNAWGDWMEGILGAMRAAEDWWNTSWKRQPLPGLPRVPDIGAGKTVLGVPEGYRGRR